MIKILYLIREINHVDLYSFNWDFTELVVNKYTEINVESILALGELKTAIDPAGGTTRKWDAQ